MKTETYTATQNIVSTWVYQRRWLEVLENSAETAKQGSDGYFILLRTDPSPGCRMTWEGQGGLAATIGMKIWIGGLGN